MTELGMRICRAAPENSKFQTFSSPDGADPNSLGFL